MTGWHATELAGVRAADTVAVFGAGAVGLLAAYSALLRGASEVYSVDLIHERLDKAAELGFVPVDVRQANPVEQIRDQRRGRPAARLPGEEEMGGVMAGIDAVGFQARERRHPDREDPGQVINDLARLVNPTGRLGIADVFTTTDAAPAPEGGHADGSLQVPWAALFSKGVTVGFGRTHDRRHNTHLRDLIISGRARPGQIVTHHESLENAPSIYDRFDRRADGIVKAVFHHRVQPAARLSGARLSHDPGLPVPAVSHPDVFLSDGAVAPLCHGYHPAAVLEFSDYACPVTGSELDRMGPDLRWRPTGGLDHGLHGVDVFLDAVGWRLPVNIHEHVVGVVAGEKAVPVGPVPCREVKIVHAVQVASDLIVCHVNAPPGPAGPAGLATTPAARRVLG